MKKNVIVMYAIIVSLFAIAFVIGCFSLSIASITFGVVLGIAFGLTFSILFIQMDLDFKKILFITSEPVVLIVSSGFFLKYLGNAKNLIMVSITITVFITILTSVIFIQLFSNIMSKITKNRLNIYQIIFSQKKSIADYFANEQAWVSVSHEKEEIEHRVKELEDKQRELDEQRAQQTIEKTRIKKIKSKLYENAKASLHLSVPLNFHLPLVQDNIDMNRSFVEAYSKFIVQMRRATDIYTEQLLASKSEPKIAYVKLIAFFQLVCSNIVNFLFELKENERVRAHIRIADESVYHAVASWLNYNEYNIAITDMPLDRGMVFHAIKNNVSLIRTANEEKFHVSGKHDKEWRDYITIPIELSKDSSDPYISIGISVQVSRFNIEMLYFLASIGIEKHIATFFSEINDTINIKTLYRQEHACDKD